MLGLGLAEMACVPRNEIISTIVERNALIEFIVRQLCVHRWCQRGEMLAVEVMVEVLLLWFIGGIASIALESFIL